MHFCRHLAISLFHRRTVSPGRVIESLESKKQCKKIRQILDEVDAGTPDYALSVIIPHVDSIICEKCYLLLRFPKGQHLLTIRILMAWQVTKSFDSISVPYSAHCTTGVYLQGFWFDAEVSSVLF